MLKKGIYLQGVPQEMDKDILVKHTIVQVYDPNERGYCDEPIVRSTYLQPDVMPILPAGTLVSFDIDMKQRKREDGTKYERPVPVEIKPLTADEIAKLFPSNVQSNTPDKQAVKK